MLDIKFPSSYEPASNKFIMLLGFSAIVLCNVELCLLITDVDNVDFSLFYSVKEWRVAAATTIGENRDYNRGFLVHIVF
jgi:hypothetical protein